jgi:hypothetical protein
MPVKRWAVLMPKIVDVLHGVFKASQVPAFRMWAEDRAIEIVTKLRVQSESVAVK